MKQERNGGHECRTHNYNKYANVKKDQGVASLILFLFSL